MKKPNILVVGSLVTDLVVTTARFPEIGETVLGSGFFTAAGGKGLNQAVCAARLGADVTMIGKVGNDDFGRKLITSAAESGVDVSHIGQTDDAPTAIGNIQLQTNENGTDNRIIVVSGANMEIKPCDVAFLQTEISKFDIVILQHEIPLEINLLVARYAKAAGVRVMLNPAPYADISGEMLKLLTYISPNETEAAALVGIAPDSDDAISKIADRLQSKGVENVLITLGSRGCAYKNCDGMFYNDSVKDIEVLDTTAAGDSFVAAFCTAVSAGIDIQTALKFANFTAGITVSRMGAQPSLPTLNEVLSLMEKNGLETQTFNILR